MKTEKETMDVYFFVKNKVYDGTLEVENPDRLGNHKTALLTVKEPLDIPGKFSLVSDTKLLTRSWEVVVPNHHEGTEHEVIVLTCSRIFKKPQDNKK